MELIPNIGDAGAVLNIFGTIVAIIISIIALRSSNKNARTALIHQNASNDIQKFMAENASSQLKLEINSKYVIRLFDLQKTFESVTLELSDEAIKTIENLHVIFPRLGAFGPRNRYSGLREDLAECYLGSFRGVRQSFMLRNGADMRQCALNFQDACSTGSSAWFDENTNSQIKKMRKYISIDDDQFISECAISKMNYLSQAFHNLLPRIEAAIEMVELSRMELGIDSALVDSKVLEKIYAYGEAFSVLSSWKCYFYKSRFTSLHSVDDDRLFNVYKYGLVSCEFGNVGRKYTMTQINDSPVKFALLKSDNL